MAADTPATTRALVADRPTLFCSMGAVAPAARGPAPPARAWAGAVSVVAANPDVAVP